MQEAQYYHAVALALQADYRKIAALKSRSLSWKEAWERLRSEGSAPQEPEEAWHTLTRGHMELLLAEDPLYPPLLKEIPWPPFGIYVRGTLPPAEVLSVAVVGTRKATEGGRTLAATFARGLAECGIAVVSGLAFGIDAAAHAGALDRRGVTVAVLATGLDRVYPRSHGQLAERIAASGALISEYPPGSPAFPFRFLERNRIVSGLSRGTVIVEAPRASGALATARFALEQNREVMVAPGPAAHPHYYGSHGLIRAGATLVASAEDILETLGLAADHRSPSSLLFQSPEEELIFRALNEEGAPLSIDNIILRTNLKPNVVGHTLTFLLLKNIIKETGAGYCIA
ncbi:MAG: DNA-protecting protein DprA [Candidatus Liptonbacteria bacterium]|nr:DNA-protecting protein DprA [Candidatus Liptonbacteria bacterium]